MNELYAIPAAAVTPDYSADIAKLEAANAKLEAVTAKLETDVAKLEAEKTAALVAEDYARVNTIQDQVAA